MESHWAENCLALTGTGGFDARASLFCGQCFRWEQTAPDTYQGVVHGAVRTLTQQSDRLTVFPCAAGEQTFFVHYLALDDDYDRILALLRRNPTLRRCVDAAPGIRVLHQEFFETLLTFIISQNNNIPRIRSIVGRLCENWGEPLPGGEYAFPTPQTLAQLTEADLACLRAGWRAGYLLDAARRVADGQVTEQQLSTLPLPEARALLRTIRGVGPKVADCVLLFGLGRADAFPTDVWMKRAMSTLFPRGLPRYLTPWAGVAQQFIFDYARRNPALFDRD